MVIRVVIRMVIHMVIRMVIPMVILYGYGVLKGPQYDDRPFIVLTETK